MNNSSNILIDEIRVHFLTCFLCSAEYKRPKSLSCMHAFCQTCLEKYYENDHNANLYRFLNYAKAISCPICESKTTVPVGGIERLQNNFFLDNLNQVLDKGNETAIKSHACEICRKKDHCEVKAISRCLDCLKLLCKICTKMHESTNVTKTHTLIDVSDYGEILCKEHQAEVAKFYCEQCESCICIICTFADHKNHKVISLDKALSINTNDLEDMLNSCLNKVNIYRDILMYLNHCQSEMKMIEDTIREESMTMVAAIRKGERCLISDLERAINEKAKNLLINKDIINMKLQKLEGSYKITKVLLDKKNYELLKAKRSIKEQLFSVLNSEDYEDFFILDRFVFMKKNTYVKDLIDYIYKDDYLNIKFLTLSKNSTEEKLINTNIKEYISHYKIVPVNETDNMNYCHIISEEPSAKMNDACDKKTQTQFLHVNQETMTIKKIYLDKNISTDINSYLDKITTTNDLNYKEYYNKHGNLYDEFVPFNLILSEKESVQRENDMRMNTLTANNQRASAIIRNGSESSQIKIKPSKIKFSKPQPIIIKTSKILK